jgi:hypothetical protein
MLRAASVIPAASALRRLIERTLVTAAAGTLRSEDARLRAELVGAQMLGLFISRCVVGVEPLAHASVEEVVALLAPALDRLSTKLPILIGHGYWQFAARIAARLSGIRKAGSGA